MTTSVRTFRAVDARAALAMVKAALGPDAVILSTAEVPGGLFRKNEIEVTAGVSSPTPPTPPRPALPQSVAEAVAAAASKPPPTRLTPEDSPLSAEFSAMRQAMDSMRLQLQKLATGTQGATAYQLPPAAASLFGHLRQRGVEEALAEELVRHAIERSGNQPQQLLSATRSLLADWLVGSRAPWLNDRPKIVALIGPTGVGKTTTLAKIGARAVIESKLKVAMITIDTYRIGASEQLCRYGQIMGVPAWVARDRAELHAAVEKSQGMDLVLIDTAGRSTEEALQKQHELLRTVPGLGMYLVLAATASGAQLASVAERYRALRPERLIFTKLDEAVAPGAVVSAAVRVGRPVACTTSGQRVPEDLDPVAGASLVDHVIGSWKHGSV